jgi:hypothetical protein
MPGDDVADRTPGRNAATSISSFSTSDHAVDPTPGHDIHENFAH